MATHHSKAGKRRLRLDRARVRARAYYLKHPEQHGDPAIRDRARRVVASSSWSTRGGAAVSAKVAPVTKSEPPILKEDTGKLAELSGGRLTESKLSILVHARMHHVRDIVKRMKEGNFKVSGIGIKTEQLIRDVLQKYGVEIPNT